MNDFNVCICQKILTALNSFAFCKVAQCASKYGIVQVHDNYSIYCTIIVNNTVLSIEVRCLGTMIFIM